MLASNISSVLFSFPFFFFWYSHYANVTLFIVVPEILGILFILSFFSLIFSLRNIYRHNLKLRDSFLSNFQSTNEPIKSILYFRYYVLDLQHFFVLRLSLSLLILPTLFSHVVYFFHQTPQHFNHSCFKFPAIAESGSDTPSVSSTCLLPFSIPCNIFVESQ